LTPEPDGLDTLTLSRLEELGGAPLLLEIFHLILLHSPDQVAAARAGWESGNLKAVRQAAHSLRSSAGNVGALRLAAAARRLEELAVATTPGEAASVLPALESLESEWTQVRSWLEVRLEQMELGEASS
jgi:HPt (histidine-containing phosphotransfer) domain-containing protein